MEEEATMTLDSEAERLWRAARALAAEANSSLPPLLFFTDPDRTPAPWITARALPRGAAVVYRGFGRPAALEEAFLLREATQQTGVRLLIALDADLAREVGADGLHLPEREAARAPSLRQAHADWMITAAWHPGRGRPPVGEGLDALIVSPVFTPGGASSGEPLGAVGLAKAASGSPIPCYGLGGIDAERAEGLSGTGACGIAAIQAIQTAFGRDARIRT